MKILHRYVLAQLLRNIALSLAVFVLLFLLFDFFDRIDNIFGETASLLVTVQYFVFKVPLMVSLMLPVATMVAILFTIGLLSKSSEITAMRASGITIVSLAMPIFATGLVISIFNLALNETLVPYAQRRSKEIYNLDIRQKDKRGGYSQNDFWWRVRDNFYSVGIFDSRSNSLHDFSWFKIGSDWEVTKRTTADLVTWVRPELGWTMQRVQEFKFAEDGSIDLTRSHTLALPLKEAPVDFYDVKTDPYTMSMSQLRSFLRKQQQAGLAVGGYLPYLYEKLSFPLFNFIITLIVLPFALRPARSGSMAGSVVAALVIGFSYYALHSFSLALGKAELMPPMLAAWMANLLMAFVGAVLLLGAESPS